MKRREISLEEAAVYFMKQIRGGALITTQADGEVNTMTIGWGSIGYEWSEPMFTAYVRTSRHTAELLEKNPEFTINIPDEKTDKKILGFAGTNSGRDMDKIKALNLTTVDSLTVSVPAIKECPITLECRVVHKQLQDISVLDNTLREKYYPQNGKGEGWDSHIAFFGYIQKAYILED